MNLPEMSTSDQKRPRLRHPSLPTCSLLVKYFTRPHSPSKTLKHKQRSRKNDNAAKQLHLVMAKAAAKA